MNVVDSLVVTLGLDSKDFSKGVKNLAAELKKLREGAGSTSQEISAQGKKAGEFFRSLKVEILGALAAFGATTGLKAFIVDTTTSQAALGRMATNLDMSASRLQAWGVVAKEMGGKAEDSFGALQAVAGGLAEATIKGHSALTDAARANGIQLTDAKGKVLGYEDALISISKRLVQLPRQQAMALANGMGVGGIFNELMLGPQELKARLDAAQASSRVTEESTKKAQALEKKWADFQQRLQGIRDEIWFKLEPAIEKIGDQLGKWVGSIDWDKLIDKVGVFFNKINDVVQEFGGWKTVVIALTAVLGIKFLASLGTMVGLVGRLAGFGGASGVVRGLTGSLSGLGGVLAGLDVAALAGVAGVAAAVYSPALGGPKGKDGKYADEAHGATSAAPTARDLWDAVNGKPSGYKGSRSQAALLLAQRSYLDQMDLKDYQSVQSDILSGKYKESDATYGARPQAAAAPATTGNVDFKSIEDKYGLPNGLMARVYQKESGSGKYLTSPAGAKGPFQFMPDTAAQYGLKGDDVNDLGKSADAAGHYLGDLNKKYGGDLVKTLAAYNWGPGNVDKKGLANAPSETQDYVKMAQGLQIGPPQQYMQPPAPAGGNSNEVHIGKIDVHTLATDADGISRDLGRSLRNNSLVAATNTGVE